MMAGQVDALGTVLAAGKYVDDAFTAILPDAPKKADTDAIAKAKYQSAQICLRRAFQRALVVGMLSAMSRNPKVGGSNDPSARRNARAQALSYLAAAQNNNDGCQQDPNDGDTQVLQSLINTGS